MPRGVDRVEIEFEQYSNLIIIPIKINHSITLKFVLDTGAESIIITEKLFADLLELNYVREMAINAPGVTDSIKAFVATNVNLALDNQLAGTSFTILVLQEDYIELSKNLGSEVYGIIGYDIFHRYVVDIRYDDNKLIIRRPETFKPKSYYQEIPLTIANAKPHVPMFIKQKNDQDTLLFMVDTGASHAALVDVQSSDHLVVPERVIPTRLGHGLGGEIPGTIGRVQECFLGPFHFEDVLISIPQSGAYSKAIKRGTLHGTIGGDILTRFNVVFDYVNEKMYLDKSPSFNKPFEYNMSGMTIQAEGDDLEDLKVVYVSKDTPSSDAGIKVGDVVKKINGIHAENISVSEVQQLLKSRPHKKIRMTILRDKEKIKVHFRLRRLI